jgi:hypothetical protein
VQTVEKTLEANEAIQCIVGKNQVPFGQAQCPQLHNYADGKDTLQFLLELSGNEKAELRRP